MKEEPKPQPVAAEEKKVAEEVKPVVNEVKKEEVTVTPATSEPKPVKEEPKPVVVEKPVETERKWLRKSRKRTKSRGVSRKNREERRETGSRSTGYSSREGEEGVFKIRPTEFVSKINVIGQIDLAALNQSTRPKKNRKRKSGKSVKRRKSFVRIRRNR